MQKGFLGLLMLVMVALPATAQAGTYSEDTQFLCDRQGDIAKLVGLRYGFWVKQATRASLALNCSNPVRQKMDGLQAMAQGWGMDLAQFVLWVKSQVR